MTTMKTETQEFKSLLDYEGSTEIEGIIMRLDDVLGQNICIIEDDMVRKLGKETTDAAIEDYLTYTKHIEDLVGWECMRYDSPEEQFQEEDLAWKEITDWDDR